MHNPYKGISIYPHKDDVILNNFDESQILNDTYIVSKGVTVIMYSYQPSTVSRLKYVCIPNTVRIIARNTFRHWSNLKFIEIPSSVECICNCAFYECNSLEDVVIRDGLQFICSYAFADCKSLEYVELPATLKYIDYETFANCTHLTSINIPDNVYIADGAFYACDNLDKETKEKIKSINPNAFMKLN